MGGWSWGEWEDDEAAEEAWPLFMVVDGALRICSWDCAENASSPAAEGYGPTGPFDDRSILSALMDLIQ